MTETIRVECDPGIMLGKPVIAGTRITVQSILEKLAAGDSPSDIARAHPEITEEAVRAALRFAAASFSADFVYPTLTAA